HQGDRQGGRLAQHHVQRGRPRLRADGADAGVADGRDRGRAGQADAAPARGHGRGRGGRRRLPLLAQRGVRHRARAGGRRRALGLSGMPASRVAMFGSKLPPIALTTNCPECGVGLVPEELRDHVYVCDCGHHFRMHSEAWIALLADAGSWQERWADVRPHDLLDWKVPKPYEDTIEQAREEGLNEAVRVGAATLDGRAVWLAVFDFRFVGGTLSIVAGERLARGLEQATATRTP